ncbi:EAL domain-containing protein [Clostridium ganghwense]|uniref:EAL domain-containing protein n=1 Tax=Clostridium ganghwense TaxID=312089 RepID=A0ABT4CM53_9CLOT|nr:EAL domain-containing protein [Clostridium ganghwense]MCY6369181.1 EAL domain-containing protein [Clostridium ganghwense]
MKYKFSELVDIKKLQLLLDNLCKATGIRSAIIEPDGTILTASGWKRVCTEFHRVNPLTRVNCIESDKSILNGRNKEKKYIISKCRNGMCDIGAPIIINDCHLATVFTGQFFLEEQPDIEYFMRVARKVGFDEEEYINAIKEVEVFGKEEIKPIVEYLAEFANWITEIGYNRLKQLEANEKLNENYLELSAVYEELAAIEEELRIQYNDLCEKEELLRVNERRYKLAVDGANDGIFDVNIESGKIFISNRGKDIFDIEEKGNVFYIDDIEEYKCNGNNNFFIKKIQEIINRDIDAYNHEMKFRDKYGKEKYILCRGKALRKDGKIIYVAGSFTDISNRKKTERITNRLAYHNPVTGLKNRTYIMEEYPKLIEKIKKENGKAALIFLDIDNFKAINDTFGHSAGDEFLRKISKKLRKILRDKDYICHLGGDEFLFLIRSLKEEKELKYIAENLLNIFKNTFRIKNEEINYITASIGIAVLKSKGDNFQTLFNHADDAMHCAKREGKNRYKIYTAGMNSIIYYETKLHKDLKYALKNDEFKVYYQPKIDISTGNISGVEALVRWIKRDGKIIPPNKFINFAEERGLIGDISEKVIRTACIQNKKWYSSKKNNFRVAVNLSAFELQDEKLFVKIKNLLDATGLLPELFEVEITESVVMKNFNTSIKTLNKLREIGIKVSLDDFGTGYSSLNYLKNLPIDTIKLDKTFIDNLTTDSKEKFIVSALIDLSHGINLKVVAEGVESKEQFNILKEYGCDEIQGYYFSKPVSDKEFETSFLNDHAL